MIQHNAERVSDYTARTDTLPLPQCRLCRTTMVGDEAGRSWRLTTSPGDAWGYAVIICEGCARDMADMAAAVALAEAMEETL